MEQVGGLVLPSRHIWILPQQGDLEDDAMVSGLAGKTGHDGRNQELTSCGVSPECHSALAKLGPGPELEFTS